MYHEIIIGNNYNKQGM